MGPELDLALRRSRPAAPDLEREAMKQPAATKKKVGTPSQAVSFITPSMSRWKPWQTLQHLNLLALFRRKDVFEYMDKGGEIGAL